MSSFFYLIDYAWVTWWSHHYMIFDCTVLHFVTTSRTWCLLTVPWLSSKAVHVATFTAVNVYLSPTCASWFWCLTMFCWDVNWDDLPSLNSETLPCLNLIQVTKSFWVASWGSNYLRKTRIRSTYRSDISVFVRDFYSTLYPKLIPSSRLHFSV